MKTFEVEVRTTVKVTLDETKFTEEFMENFRKNFYPFYELQEHAEHIAQLEAREYIYNNFVEGYGNLDDFDIKAEVLDVSEETLYQYDY